MRKIERDMIAAIRAGKSRSLGNTSVECSTVHNSPEGASWAVRLHGNLIAQVFAGGPLNFTLAGWPTPTTRSRINALCREFGAGAGVWQSKGKQWAECPRFGVRDGAPREISPTEWVQA